MADISFKQFLTIVDQDTEPTAAQLDEIFGIFRNNAKLDKIKKQQAELHAKRKELRDKKAAALTKKDTGWSGSLGAPKGGIADADWDNALDSRDRKFLAKKDRMNMATEARLNEHRFGKKKNSRGKWIICDPEGGDLSGYGEFDTEEEVDAKRQKLNGTEGRSQRNTDKPE